MILNLTKENIENLLNTCNFFEKNNFYNSEDKIIGRGHYSLFAAIGIQLINSKIIEIGTCTGHSILSFSNNSTINNNTLFTYDINPCNVCQNILKTSGAIFSNINLFDPKIRESNINHILSANIIFIDIDPHIGIIEYDMVLWLKKNKYEGLIILDDIYLSKTGHEYENRKIEGHYMYQNLWAKIPDNEKICISNVGHSSGTGIVCFNFEKHKIII